MEACPVEVEIRPIDNKTVVGQLNWTRLNSHKELDSYRKVQYSQIMRLIDNEYYVIRYDERWWETIKPLEGDRIRLEIDGDGRLVKVGAT